MVNCLMEGSKQNATASLVDLWQSYRGQVEEKFAVEISSTPISFTTATTSNITNDSASTVSRSSGNVDRTNSLSIREQFQQATQAPRSGELMMLSSSPKRMNNNSVFTQQSSNNNNSPPSPPPPLPPTTTGGQEIIKELRENVAELRHQLNEKNKHIRI